MWWAGGGGRMKHREANAGFHQASGNTKHSGSWRRMDRYHIWPMLDTHSSHPSDSGDVAFAVVTVVAEAPPWAAAYSGAENPRCSPRPQIQPLQDCFLTHRVNGKRLLKDVCSDWFKFEEKKRRLDKRTGGIFSSGWNPWRGCERSGPAGQSKPAGPGLRKTPHWFIVSLVPHTHTHTHAIFGHTVHKILEEVHDQHNHVRTSGKGSERRGSDEAGTT